MEPKLQTWAFNAAQLIPLSPNNTMFQLKAFHIRTLIYSIFLKYSICIDDFVISVSTCVNHSYLSCEVIESTLLIPNNGFTSLILFIALIAC